MKGHSGRLYSGVMGSVLGLAAFSLLTSCSDPVGLEQEEQRKGLETPEVQQKPMTLVVHPAAPEIAVGQTIRLWATLHGADGRVIERDFPARWSTSRPDQVSITEDGYATGILPGESRIVAQSELGSDWTYVTVHTSRGRDIPGDGDEEKRKLHEDGDVLKRR